VVDRTPGGASWSCVGEQRRLHCEELAILRVLDERGRIDPSMGSDGESAHTVRDKVATARALESLPAIAAAACEGRLSDEQLRSVTKGADEFTDAEWARRAPNVVPLELARLARTQLKPSAEDSRARFAARELRMWRSGDDGMLNGRFRLPDEMGERFEATIQRLTERMRPAKGQPWDSFEHRAADALLALCDPAPGQDEDVAILGPRPNIQVAVGRSGTATIAGIPIADTLLEQLRANATIELVLVDDDAAPVVVGRRTPIISEKVRRAVLLRDGQCRISGCGRRQGLQVHHLQPRSLGGTDDISNLAAVCAAHHRLLIPHGLLALVGNPNLPDGLHLMVAADRGPPKVA
jgi:hypothetical protein